MPWAVTPLSHIRSRRNNGPRVASGYKQAARRIPNCRFYHLDEIAYARAMSESEIERLRRELEHERHEKEEARAREEEARAREESERLRNQNTTLEEYLYNCHFAVYQKFDLALPSQSSTGFTKVDGKYYPKRLRPWVDFRDTHRQYHFEAIKEACGGERRFPQESTISYIGTTISRKRAGNESAVDHFEKLAVEDPVWEIL
jgi:hypothetical protein